jgi:hypothetical protein
VKGNFCVHENVANEFGRYKKIRIYWFAELGLELLSILIEAC